MAGVTKEERARAYRQSRETARFERKSEEAAMRLGAKLQSRTLKLYRSGDWTEIPNVVTEEFLKIRPVLSELMTVGYLVGLDRIRSARKKTVEAGLHTDAIKFLEKRLEVDPARMAEITRTMENQSILMLTRLEDQVNQSLAKTMLEATQEGLTTREGEKRMRKAFAANGIVPYNSFEMEAQFRTQTMMAYGAGAWDSASDPVVDEILWGFRYVTVGDDRVRPEHFALDGTTAPKDHPIWGRVWPPNGFNCRCQIIFVYEQTKPYLPSNQVEVDGRMVVPGPDKGFDFNPGTVLSKGPGPRGPSGVGAKPKPSGKPPWARKKAQRN